MKLRTASDSWRDGKTTAQRGYGGRWQRAREQYLRLHPLCTMCEQQDRITAATVVDHIKPHEGDQTLFWRRSNWQALCKTHHDSDKQRLEKSGRVTVRIGLDGFPVEAGG